MQLSPVKKSLYPTGVEVFRKGGIIRGFYSGLTANFLRQWTYGSCRIGVYSFLLKNNKGKSVNFVQKMQYGFISGAIGSIVGTPADLAMVRLGAAATIPKESRKSENVFSCLYATVRRDGVLGMWRGCFPTLLRATSLASVMLATTSQTKEYLPKYVPEFQSFPTLVVVISSTHGSFWGSVASQPFDVLKSEMQKPVRGGVYPGVWTVVKNTAQKGGLPGFWRGFAPAFMKQAPFTMLSLTLVELLTIVITGKDAL